MEYPTPLTLETSPTGRPLHQLDERYTVFYIYSTFDGVTYVARSYQNALLFVEELETKTRKTNSRLIAQYAYQQQRLNTYRKAYYYQAQDGYYYMSIPGNVRQPKAVSNKKLAATGVLIYNGVIAQGMIVNEFQYNIMRQLMDMPLEPYHTITSQPTIDKTYVETKRATFQTPEPATTTPSRILFPAPSTPTLQSTSL
jgi:hypothetical protein